MSLTRMQTEPLGARAIRAGCVREDDVKRALAEQSRRQESGKRRSPLGLLMVEMGILSPRLLVNLLDVHNASGFHLHEDAVNLAATLNASIEEHDREILFTGLDPDDGVATLVSQVGSAMALLEPGAVLVLDANFRRPSLHERFFTSQTPGFSDVLDRKVALEEAIFPTGIANLSLLPAGGGSMDHVKLLMSEDCRGVLETLRAKFRLVLVSCASLVTHSETTLLASRMDGAVLAVPAGRRQRSEIEEVNRVLSGLNVPLIGTVLTQPVRGRRRRQGAP